MSEKKPLWLKIVIFVILFTIDIVLYFDLNEYSLLHQKAVSLGISSAQVYQIESVEEVDGKVIISGFFFQTSKAAEREVKQIVLHDLVGNKHIRCKVELTDRPDVNEYFKCDYDFTKSGFVAVAKASKVDFENGKYQIYFKSESTGDNIRALSQYLMDGKIYSNNLLEYPQFDYSDALELEELLADADLLVSRPDVGVCIYQKDKMLYWVVNEQFDFDEEETVIEWQMNTTQVEKLPQYRLDNQWYWDNRGFAFEKKEMYGEWGRYRVACSKIPDAFSVCDIWTGCYDDDWKWLNRFYPRYEFFFNIE